MLGGKCTAEPCWLAEFLTQRGANPLLDTPQLTH